jgi:hypothetical protein
MAPTFDNADIANLVSGDWYNGDYGAVFTDWPVQGQTFTTGGNAQGYSLNAVTVQHGNYSYNEVGWGPFTVQVGTVSGSVLTPILTTTTSNGLPDAVLAHQYLTVRFDSPVHLGPNTTYGFDWGSSLGGFLIASNTANSYTRGDAYQSGANSIPDNGSLSFYGGVDRVFHLDMTAVPEPSTCVLGGIGLISLMAYAWRKRKCVPS